MESWFKIFVSLTKWSSLAFGVMHVWSQSLHSGGGLVHSGSNTLQRGDKQEDCAINSGLCDPLNLRGAWDFSKSSFIENLCAKRLPAGERPPTCLFLGDAEILGQPP